MAPQKAPSQVALCNLPQVLCGTPRRATWSPEEMRQEALGRAPRLPRGRQTSSCTTHRPVGGPLRATPESRGKPKERPKSVTSKFQDDPQRGQNQTAPCRYWFRGSHGVLRGAPRNPWRIPREAFRRAPRWPTKAHNTMHREPRFEALWKLLRGPSSWAGLPAPAATTVHVDSVLPFGLPPRPPFLVVGIASSPRSSSPCPSPQRYPDPPPIPSPPTSIHSPDLLSQPATIVSFPLPLPLWRSRVE